MESLWQDIRFGLRTLRKAPGFAIVAIAALALGIGANTAIFSVVNGVMLRPLPFPEPSRLMDIYHVYPGMGLAHVTVSPITLDFYRKNQKSFESLGAFSGWRAPANLTGSGEPQRVRSISVAGEFFRTMGTNPAIGRFITAEDDRPGHSRVVVLSDGIWKRLFAGDPGIVGKTITLDGSNYEVIGIMPPSFDYPSKTDLWVPMGMTPEQWQRGTEYMTVVGRLKPGISPKQAKAEMTKLTAALREAYAKEFEGDTSGWRVDTQPLSELIRGDLRPALLVLLGAVGCVLLIACVNTANLLLARATARQREIATRAALGARRLRIVRQLVVESMVLWLAGGLVGLMVGYAAVALLLSLLPIQLPTFIKVTIDPTVMSFTLLLSFITGVLFGLIPALRLSKPDLIGTLKEGRGSAGTSHARLRDAFVVGEMAIAVLLLVSAGLMVRSFVKYQGARIGFDPDHVLTFMAALPEQKYKAPVQARAFFREAEPRLKTIPGVEHVGIVGTLPLIGTGWMNSYVIQGKQLRPQPHSYFTVASAEYFQSLNIELERGRVFRDSDVESSPLVALIDDKAAKMYFGSEDPIGQHLSIDNDPATKQPRWREIVGVVGSVKHTANIGDDPKGQVYLPYTQQAGPPMMMFAIRTAGDPNAIVSSARAKIREVDPEQPIFEVSSMDKIRDENIAAPRFNTVLLSIFGGLALALAAVGIYGVLSYTVTQRTHEIGLRMALGASRVTVIGMVLKHAATLAAIGLGIGLAAALFATRLLRSLLFHVGSTDPLTYTAIIAILWAVALLASYAPAHRAANVDPMVALRNE